MTSRSSEQPVTRVHSDGKLVWITQTNGSGPLTWEQAKVLAKQLNSIVGVP